MPKSRNRKEHKEKSKTYKNKKQIMSQNAELAKSMPEIRNIPNWDGNAIIPVKGYEWEAIVNAFSQLQIGTQAIQAVMSRGIVEGVITMNFEKLDPQTLTYKEMAPEEKLKYQTEFAEAVKAFKEGLNKPKEKEPDSNLVNTDGEPSKSTELTAETPKQEAKVIVGDFVPKQ